MKAARLRGGQAGRRGTILLIALSLIVGAAVLRAQVPWDRLLRADSEPENWLTYSGNNSGWRYSPLKQITPANAKTLEMKWAFQADSTEKLESSPLVVDGVMYVTQPPNDIIALDAKTGRIFWIYQYRVAPDARVCCGRVNRGLAILGDTLFMGTIDAHLVAVNAKSGRLLWDTKVATAAQGYAVTMAPLVVKDKVIIGTAGGEQGIIGFIAGFDAASGKKLWQFNTIPGPGEPGNDTWGNDSWKHGAGSLWVTGSYDPDLNLTYWGIGNPGPDWNPDKRPGDNLYTCSAVALDPDTGQLKWHFQFTPHDGMDWDSAQVPVLVNMNWNGTPRKLMLWANRNGFFYVLDRTNGKFVRGAPFVKVNWADGLDENGRPKRLFNTGSKPGGTLTFPNAQGGTNWFSPSWSPHTGLFYVGAWNEAYALPSEYPVEFVEGRGYTGGSPSTPMPNIRRPPVNYWTEAAGHGEIKAIDPRTGDFKWIFKMHDVTDAGVLTTASDVLFAGNREGYVIALDARDGTVLWRAMVSGQISSSPISYAVDGKQYVAISAFHTVFAFGLRE
jgi:alcohol dehydrogenase (cytochrome c)